MNHDFAKRNGDRSSSDIDGMEVVPDNGKHVVIENGKEVMMEHGDDSIEMQDMMRYSGTSQDLHDMQVLGKTQVLNVRLNFSICRFKMLTRTEKLSVHLNFGICVYTDEYLGNRSDVSSALKKMYIPDEKQDKSFRSSQWRNSRPSLGISGSLVRLHTRLRYNCGDGLHGTHIWRTISLGF